MTSKIVPSDMIRSPFYYSEQPATSRAVPGWY
jgi:hypothetical protein